MINKAKFENIASGASIMLHDANWPFSDYTTEVDVRMDEEERGGEWGIHETYTYLGKRLHHIEGDLLAEDSADYWMRRMDFIQAVTPSKTKRVFGKLRLELEGVYEETWCYCTLDGWPELPLESLSPSAGRFLVTFKSYDPRLYGSYLNEVTTGTLSASEGREYPKTYDYTYSHSSSGSTAVYNAGNADTPPTVYIYGPCSDPRIQINNPDLSNDSVIVETTLAAGEYIVIDFREQTVFDSLGQDIYSLLNSASEWWELKPGPNDVAFFGANAVDPARAVIKWNNAYLI